MPENWGDPITYSDDTAEAAEASLIDRVLIDGDKALAELDELLDLLRHAIDPILGPTEPTEAPGSDSPMPPMSVVATRITEHNDRVQSMSRRVDLLLRRIEV